ncbi:MAG: heparinase II/III family protein [Bacteroidales bacterium]|nr:heparinase II/III family protein [Bacteroidales bacterium]
MKKILILLSALLLAGGSVSWARNNLFEDRAAALEAGMPVVKVGGAWFPYPAYSDRKGWDKLLGKQREAIIENAERALKYEWQPLKATTFLEFEKTGDRALMKPEDQNRRAITGLMMGELAEGKGRFLPKLIDLVWLECTRISWQTASHSTRQPSGRCLPSYGPESQAVELHSSYLGSAIAVCWHFLHEAFDKYDPSISQTMLRALKYHIFDPYMDQEMERFHNWMGFGEQTHAINNWNTTCNTHVFLAFALAEQDQQKLNAAVSRIFTSIDNYLSYIKQDGCCDEGPGYWRMASGKFYEFARYVCDATEGRINVFDDPLLRKAGEFRSKIDLGDGWVVDFGDGEARTSPAITHLAFRYGCDIGSKELMDYATYLSISASRKGFSKQKLTYSEVMYTLEFLRYNERFLQYRKDALEAAGGNYDELYHQLRSQVTSVWYDQTQQCLLRNGKGWALAAKGGHNEESHNHNDCGSCILFIDETPVLIDPGTATYGKDTFSGKRYQLWHISALSHNVPTVNGEIEQYGPQFRTSDNRCDLQAGTFTTDIAGTFPKEAEIKSYRRTYRLGADRLVIDDVFQLGSRKAADEVRFTVRGNVSVKGDKVEITSPNFKGDESVTVVLTGSKNLTPSVTVVPLTDPRLQKIWGNELKTIVFRSSQKAPLSGSYHFELTRK